jgi:hypothetical protein
LASAIWEDELHTTQPTLTAQPSFLTKTSYANYVLGALTVCYVLNTMDRSQILAAAISRWGC